MDEEAGVLTQVLIQIEFEEDLLFLDFIGCPSQNLQRLGRDPKRIIMYQIVPL